MLTKDLYNNRVHILGKANSIGSSGYVSVSIGSIIRPVVVSSDARYPADSKDLSCKTNSSKSLRFLWLSDLNLSLSRCFSTKGTECEEKLRCETLRKGETEFRSFPAERDQHEGHPLYMWGRCSMHAKTATTGRYGGRFGRRSGCTEPFPPSEPMPTELKKINFILDETPGNGREGRGVAALMSY
jgi:hypothetical protein